MKLTEQQIYGELDPLITSVFNTTSVLNTSNAPTRAIARMAALLAMERGIDIGIAHEQAEAVYQMECDGAWHDITREYYLQHDGSPKRVLYASTPAQAVAPSDPRPHWFASRPVVKPVESAPSDTCSHCGHARDSHNAHGCSRCECNLPKGLIESAPQPVGDFDACKKSWEENFVGWYVGDFTTYRFGWVDGCAASPAADTAPEPVTRPHPADPNHQGPYWLGAQNDALWIVKGYRPATSNDDPNHEADREPICKVENARQGYEIVATLNAETRLLRNAAPISADTPDDARGLDTATRVRFYEHDFYPLSNFSAFTLEWRGIRFDTSEAVYHYEKFVDVQPAIARSIFRAESAHEAFKIAEANRDQRRPDWDAVKVDIMRRILRAKVDQHEYVRRKLLATGDRELVEDSWRDDFWGWGANRDGQNMLGKLWMEIRRAMQSSVAQEKP